MPESPFTTIFFDVGGTIITAHPSVADVYAGAARRLGHDVDAARIGDNFRRAWRRSLARRERNGHVCDDAILRDEWLQVVIDAFEGLLPESAARVAFEDLYERFRGAAAWTVAARARETFETLRARGFRLGLLSNWDERLEDTLAQLGLLDFFDLRVISYRVGVEKPHPRIFEEALRLAAAPASRVLHVGDSWEWDIEPARRHGLSALWIAPLGIGPESDRPSDAVPLAAPDPAPAGAAARVASFADVLPWIEAQS